MAAVGHSGFQLESQGALGLWLGRLERLWEEKAAVEGFKLLWLVVKEKKLSTNLTWQKKLA